MLNTLVDVFLIILGVICMSENISLVHWYHKWHVAKENQKKFSMLVGIGILIVGLSMIFNDVF